MPTEKPKLEIVLKPLSSLTNWSKNPRSIKKDDYNRLKAQIQNLGIYKPLITTADGTVLGGNMRLKVYQELGIQNVPVVIVDAPTDAKKLEYCLSDNDRAGSWDEQDLAELITLHGVGLHLEDYKIDLGQARTLSELMDQFGPDNKEDEVPEVTDEPISKYGEVYELGPHRVMCGDATKIEDVNTLMQKEKANMVFTDPPYNVDYTGGMGTHEKNERSGIMNDKMTAEQFQEFLQSVCKNIMEKTTGGIYICMSSSELGTLTKAFEQAGGHWQTFIIWVKNNFTLSRADYQHTYEPILYGWPDSVVNHYFSQDRDNPNVWEDLKEIDTKYDGENTIIKFQGFEVKIKGKAEGEVKRKKQKIDIWRYDKPSRSEEHPTMKPVRLCYEAVRNSSQRGDIVLDLFGGSGSTLIACEQLKRACYMCELAPQYVDVIIKRWMKFTGQRAYKIKDADGNQLKEPVQFADESFMESKT